MSNLLTVVVVGVLICVVASVLLFGLQKHSENEELKVEIEKLEEYKEIYEDWLKESNRVLETAVVSHKSEVKWYKGIIRDLKQQLEEQSNPMDNRIEWIKEQIEKKTDVIDKYTKEYRELLDELDRARNQR